MNNILLGYEVYESATDKGKNFNGRINPSTKIDNECLVNDFYKKYHEVFITPETCSDDAYKLLFGCFFGNAINRNLIKRKQVSDIKNQIYFYPIEILSINLFIRTTSHIAISEKVRYDILNGKAYILIRYISEGDMQLYLNEFNNLIKELSLPKENILVFHGDLSKERYADCAFTYVPVNSFPFWVQQFKRENIATYEYDERKLFVSYNRRPRQHRIALSAILLHAGLTTSAIYSFPVTNKDNIVNINQNILSGLLNENEIDELAQLSGFSPDGLNLQTTNPAINIVEDHYTSTFCSLVTETLYDTIFLTEKIYKPILMGHPFILLGAPGTLQYLRNLGFKTFSNWWDESYDTTENLFERCNKIAEILNNLNNKTSHQLRLIRCLMKPVLVHNQKLFNRMIADNRFNADLDVVKYIERLI